MDKPLVTISYKLADGSQISVEVSTPVKELLEQSDRQIRSQRRQDRRHLDFKVNTDGNSDSPLLPTYEDTADLLERMERDARLHNAQADLDLYEFFKSQGAAIVNDAADFTGTNGCYLYQGRDIAESKNSNLKDHIL